MNEQLSACHNNARIDVVVVTVVAVTIVKAVRSCQDIAMSVIVADPDPRAITNGFAIPRHRDCGGKLRLIGQGNMRPKTRCRVVGGATFFRPGAI